MISPVIQAALAVLFGALAGGLTNSLAIWMLFHPYEPPRLFGRRLNWFQGAIPKNRTRLARALGRTVGSHLLTPDDLAATLREPAFRRTFDERLAAFVSAVLERPRASLAEELPATAAHELRALLDDVASDLITRLETHLGTDEFDATARRWADALADELRDRPLDELLTAERERALAGAVDAWIADAVGGAGFEAAIDEYLDSASHRLLDPGQTFEEVLPTGLVAALERGIAAYLPLAIERLAGLLEDPAARRRVERVLHEILDRFMRDLRFHQRVVAALVITPETVEKVLQTIERDGAQMISELLQDPAMRDGMARSVNEAVVEFLRRPVTDVLGEPGDESVVAARETIAAAAVKLARDENTRSFLIDKLNAAMEAAERRTWNDLFRHLPPGRFAEAVTDAARSRRAGEIYRDAADRAVSAVMHRPIGRPADRLPADGVDRVRTALADPLWDWVQERVPDVAARLDIAGRVEEKVEGFETERLERLVRDVTARELRLIVRLGYGLGAMIGLLLVGLNAIAG